MRLLLPALAALCLTTATASAWIGETRAQIEARMGAPTAVVTASDVEYTKDGMQVTVIFSGGISVAEMVSKLPDANGNPVPMSDGERTRIFSAYGAGLTWDKDQSSDTWLRSDKKLIASRRNNSQLSFAELEYAMSLGPPVEPRSSH